MNEPAIAVIGDGKMGRTIAQMIQERGWHLTAMLDQAHNGSVGPAFNHAMNRALNAELAIPHPPPPIHG